MRVPLVAIAAIARIKPLARYWYAVPDINGTSAPIFFCSKVAVVLPIKATRIPIPLLTGMSSSKVGPKTKTTPINPITRPTTCCAFSCSPKIFTAKSETKTGCRLVTTAATPAGSPLEIE